MKAVVTNNSGLDHMCETNNVDGDVVCCCTLIDVVEPKPPCITDVNWGIIRQ